MPELPEVETICRGLAKALVGARVVSVDARRPDLRTPLPPNLAARLKGRRIIKIRRRAKYILIDLDRGERGQRAQSEAGIGCETLILHLGMSGRMVIAHKPAKAEKHDHLIFYFDNGVSVTFNDPRRFGLCDIAATDVLENNKLFRHLGIEPLEKNFTASWLAAKLRGKKTSLKAALLDQRLIVGVGNIYACEAMFYAVLNPKRRAGALKREEMGRLVPAIRKVLKAAISAGGSSLRDYVQADGELGYFQHHFAVYDREGKPCKSCTCNVKKTGGVKRIAQGGRSTFYCPVKQV
jgi:formamidopyrimidine-DNA glycosylase